MSKKVLIRKQAGGGLQYQVTQEGSKPRTPLMQNLAAVRGGARGLVTDPNTNNVRQGFIPGAELGAAKPTGMQRLAAGANIAGTGLAAALTGLQTAYGLQGGNLGALASAKDQFRANVGGLTGGSPTEAQQAQNMATEAFERQQQQMANDAMMQQATPAPTNQSGPTGGRLPGQQGPTLGELPTAQPAPAGLPAPPVPAQTTPAPTQPGQTNLTQFSQTAPTPAQDDTNTLASVVGKVSVPASETTTSAPASGAQDVMPNPQGFASSDPNRSVNRSLAAYYPPPLPDHPAPGHEASTTPQLSPAGKPFVGTGGPAPTAEQLGQQSQVSYRYDPNMQPGFAGITGTPGNVNPQPQQDPGVDYQNLIIDGIRFGSQSAFDLALQRRKNASFAIQVLDEFGDMLHKADPHVAGLLAFRVFMDKVMKE